MQAIQATTELHCRPQNPRREFFFPNALCLALALLAAGDRDDLLEYLLPNLLRAHPIKDNPSIDVHVAHKIVVHRRVGGDLDRGSWLEAEHGAAPGGEDDHVGA